MPAAAAAMASLSLYKFIVVHYSHHVDRSFGTRELHKLAGALTIRDRIYYNQMCLIHHEVLNTSPLFPLRLDSASITRSSVKIQL